MVLHSKSGDIFDFLSERSADCTRLADCANCDFTIILSRSNTKKKNLKLIISAARGNKVV